MKNIFIVIAVIVVIFTGSLSAQYAKDTTLEEKPIGSMLRTVRQIDMTNDSIPEIMQIETSKAKHVRDIYIHFSIHSGKNILYSTSWKADDYFDPKDNLSDTVKWFRLQHIMHVFFSDQNFSSSEKEKVSALVARTREADIPPESEEGGEFDGTPHKTFAVYGGRDKLFGLTWLDSKKKFVTLWQN